MKIRHAIIIGGALLLLGAGCTSTTTAPTPGGTAAVAPVPAADSLDLHGQGLTELPKNVLSMTGLRELDISDNAIGGALPAEIGHLTSLEVLNASHNRMTGVPAEIGRLASLRTLDLSYNQLTGLPLELGNLSGLQTLDLRGNDVSEQDLSAISSRLPNTTILR